MKPVLAVIVAALVAVGPVAAPVAAFPAEGAVTSLGVVPASGRAELVIGVDGGVEVNDFTLRSPDRIVLDVSGASLAVGARRYDHVARGGITDVRFSQYRKGTVRVVIYLDSQRSYDVSREDGQVRVSVATDPNATFAGWQIGQPPRVASTASRAEPRRETRAPRDDARADAAAPAAAGEPSDADRADVDSDADRVAERPIARTASRRATDDRPMRIVQQAQQRSQQPRITVTYQQADIRDVLAAFAAFSGRTIIPSSSIPAIRVDAEIKDQPWDVALQAILASQGLAATEDQNGILIVDTQDRIAARAQTEPLQTRVLRLNYQRATPVAEQLRTRLLQCIPAERSGNTGGAPAGQPPVAGAPPAQPTLAGGVNPGASAPAPGMEFGACRGRGSITADEVTNAVSITAPVSMLDDLVSFAQSLDLRQPQVNIKAKIVLVNRTDLDALGIKYDLGSRNQFFSQVIQRVDSAGHLGTPADPPRVVLGGNTVSAIANASGTVNGAALRLIYSTALGGFDFSTFLDALQEVSLLDIQAEPSVTTLNNKTAELVSGVQVPFVPLISSGGSATQLNAPITVERIQTGVTLRVTPSVTNNGQIMMRVETVNSDVNFTNNGTLIDNNSNKTELLVGDGETVVIAGLTQTSVRVSKSGIPLLVDLPLIGRLFGYTTKQEQRRDLLILLTPHVIDEGESPADGAQR
ncbi:MAG TPA: AMIN domain-containing protein [Gemmatimonadaceae bacterium]|jgi:type IV pilus assembly protein PilQ|nr:AMIN domain-containing protein [Gemmatimonadaceae bacterium]